MVSHWLASSLVLGFQTACELFPMHSRMCPHPPSSVAVTYAHVAALAQSTLMRG